MTVEPLKVDGPSTTITFLGIEINSISKLMCLTTRFAGRLGISSRSDCYPIRSAFSLHFIKAMLKLKLPRRYSRINVEVGSDLEWWRMFIDC
jgi:hypothetical protein